MQTELEGQKALEEAERIGEREGEVTTAEGAFKDKEDRKLQEGELVDRNDQSVSTGQSFCRIPGFCRSVQVATESPAVHEMNYLAHLSSYPASSHLRVKAVDARRTFHQCDVHSCESASEQIPDCRPRRQHWSPLSLSFVSPKQSRLYPSSDASCTRFTHWSHGQKSSPCHHHSVLAACKQSAQSPIVRLQLVHKGCTILVTSW
jgi:hypothetical protein